MPPIRHDPKADIQLIRGILRSGYEDGFPVLKELLQNSDDAGAGRVGATAANATIVLVPDGLPGGSHALFKEPGICILNDGEFRESDAECLPTLGLSNKAADATSIGKFGIGLKTVFYLGEAFFYFCDRKVDWSEKARACDLVSPWGEYRQEWENAWLNSRPQPRHFLRRSNLIEHHGPTRPDSTISHEILVRSSAPGTTTFCQARPLALLHQPNSSPVNRRRDRVPAVYLPDYSTPASSSSSFRVGLVTS